MSEPQLLLLSFWLYTATIIFALGCHMFVASAIWRVTRGWGKALVISSASLWIINLIRLVVQLRIFTTSNVTRLQVSPILAVWLCFWSVAGFLCALAVGFVLRQTMLALVIGAGSRGESSS